MVVWDLFGDSSPPFLTFTTNVRYPMECRIIQLLDRLYPFHEAGKLFKLCPLVISRAYWNIDIDRFFNRFYRVIFLSRNSMLTRRSSFIETAQDIPRQDCTAQHNPGILIHLFDDSRCV